jgi:hypothetical protein
MPESQPGDNFSADLRSIAAKLFESSTQLPRVETSLPPATPPVPVLPPALSVAELQQPAGDIGVDIFVTDKPPLPIPSRASETHQARSPSTTDWWQNRKFRNGTIAVVAVAIAGIGVADQVAGGGDRTVAAGTHHGKLHRDRPRTNKLTTESSSASSMPSILASPSAKPRHATPYILTAPIPTTPSESPTQSPTHSNSGAGSEALTFKIGTQNQKNRLSDATHLAGLKLIFTHHVDIVGTDETGWKKYHFDRPILQKHGYDVFPKTHYSAWNQLCSRDEAVFYNAKRFTIVKHELLSLPQYPLPAVANCGNGESAKAGHANAPVLWLRDNETGEEIIEINYHNIANVKMARGSRPALIRYRANRLVMRKVQELEQKNPDTPIFVTCDCNEGTGVRHSHNVTLNGNPDNLMSHEMKQTGLMKDTSCIGPCRYHSIGGVDFIYKMPGVKTRNFHEIPSGGADSGAPSFSDHPFKYAKVTVPKSYGRKR